MTNIGSSSHKESVATHVLRRAMALRDVSPMGLTTPVQWHFGCYGVTAMAVGIIDAPWFAGLSLDPRLKAAARDVRAPGFPPGGPTAGK